MGWAPGVGVGEGVGWAAGGGAGPVQQSSRSSGRGGGEHVREEQGDDALHSPPTPLQRNNNTSVNSATHMVIIKTD